MGKVVGGQGREEMYFEEQLIALEFQPTFNTLQQL